MHINDAIKILEDSGASVKSEKPLVMVLYAQFAGTMIWEGEDEIIKEAKTILRNKETTKMLEESRKLALEKQFDEFFMCIAEELRGSKERIEYVCESARKLYHHFQNKDKVQKHIERFLNQ